MRIGRLYEFILLSDLLNYTKAADKLNITQPVLSRHIKQLEEQVGAELFRRDTHGVELTSIGYIFLEEAKKITTQYERSLHQVNTFTGKSRKKINVAFLGEAIESILREFLVVFRSQCPDVVVECRDSELDEALTYLEQRTSDVGFLLRPNFVENDRFETMLVQTDQLVAAVNKRHPLAKKDAISLWDISKWPIIRVNPGEFELSDKFSTAFLEKQSIPYQLKREFPNLKTCCFNLSLDDEVILLMPRHRSYLLSDDCKAITISDNQYWFEVEAVWDDENVNPVVPVFVKSFKTFMATLQKEELSV